MEPKTTINNGEAVLGIEFGSTRIKAVLVDATRRTRLAVGTHDWENRLENGIWTYSHGGHHRTACRAAMLP